MTDGGGVSTCIITLNGQNGLKRAVSSALNQTIQIDEVLIVDDASTDETALVAQELCAADSRIRYIRHAKNGGAAVARNTCVLNAKNDIILFLDDDDENAPTRAEKQLQCLMDLEVQHPDVPVFVYCDRLVKPLDGLPHVGAAIHNTDGSPVVGKEASLYFLKASSGGGIRGLAGSGTMIFNRKRLATVGIFDPAFRRSAEIDLAVRAGMSGAVLGRVSEPLLIQNKTRGDHKGQRKAHASKMMLISKHRKFLQSERRYAYARLKLALEALTSRFAR